MTARDPGRRGDQSADPLADPLAGLIRLRLALPPAAPRRRGPPGLAWAAALALAVAALAIAATLALDAWLVWRLVQ